MPAHGTEQTVAKTFNDLPAGIADKVILVDDGSEDNTAKVAESLGIEVIAHPRNLGYGRTQKTLYDAALAAGAEIVVLLHSDYQYAPKAVPALIEPLLAGRADFTFGSRFAAGGKPRQGGMPIHRYVGNKVTTFLENVILRTHFAELHSGLKAYTRRFLEGIPYHSYSDSYVFDSQMIVDAVLLGYRIEEVPIPTRYAPDSSSVSVANGLKYVGLTIWTCLKRKYWQRPQGTARD